MLDIEKELKALSQYKQIPNNALREKTHTLVRQEYRRMHDSTPRASAKTVRRTVRWVAVAAVAAAFMLVASLLLSPAQTAQAAAYYTVDINPSVSISVDANDIVLAATAGNSDAAALLNGLSLTGLPIEDALDAIIRSAAEDGWLKVGGHVLVAHFGNTQGLTSQQVSEIVGQSAGNTVDVLVLQSTRQDYENAEKEHKNAGMELLRNTAQTFGIDTDTDTDTIIRELRGRQGKSEATPTPTGEPAPSPAKTPKNANGNSSGQSNASQGQTDNPSNSANSGNASGTGNSGNNGNSDNTGDNGNSGNHKNDTEATPKPGNDKPEKSHKPESTNVPKNQKDKNNNQ